MVESKLSFIEMQIEGTLGQSIELGHTPLSIAPETLDPDDVSFTSSELICSMVSAEMPVKADMHQTFVTRPDVRMNDLSWVNMTAYNPLQCGLRKVRHKFCVDHFKTLQQTKENRLPSGTTSMLTSNTVGTEAGFIHFNHPIQRRGLLTSFSQSISELQIDRIHRTKRDTRHFRSHSCRQIHRKTPHLLAKISLTDSPTAVAPVFIYYFRK